MGRTFFSHGKMHKNRPQLLVAGRLVLHDDDRPHIADVLTRELREYGWDVVPYSPDMSSPAFDLFPKLKEPMRGRFSSLEELSTDGTRSFRHMNKSGILDGIIMPPKYWDSVIEKQGDYIEGL